MLGILEQELTFGGHKQLISTILFLVIGSVVLRQASLGFTDLSLGIFRLLCVGYGLYALANSMMLILLYFEDYAGALAGTSAFAAVSVTVTVLQNLFGSVEYFGLGFGLGGLAFYLIVWLRLEWYTRRLPYFLLCRKAFLPNEERGVFAKLCDYLEERDRKKAEAPKKKWKKTSSRSCRNRPDATDCGASGRLRLYEGRERGRSGNGCGAADFGRESGRDAGGEGRSFHAGGNPGRAEIHL